MISSLDISTSGLVAQRARLNAISSNIANMSSVRDENGEVKPYQARHVVLQTDELQVSTQGAAGVRVASVETENVEPRYRYQPGHPLAITEGKWPFIPTVQSWISAETGVPFSQLTHEEVAEWAKSL